MFPLHWSMLWFRFVVMYPWFVCSNQLSISSPSSAYCKRCCKGRSFSSLGTHRAQTFPNFKRSCIMLYAEPWAHTSAVATLSLSSCQLESTLPLAAQLLLSQPRNGDLVWYLIRHSNVLERISPPSCEPLYGTNISHRKHIIFIYEYSLHRVLLPKKRTKKTLIFGSILLKQGRHFDYWTQPLNICMCVCYLDFSWSWNVLLPSDLYRKSFTSNTAVLLPFVTYLLRNYRCGNLNSCFSQIVDQKMSAYFLTLSLQVFSGPLPLFFSNPAFTQLLIHLA
jgi:hypothetical protein